MRLIIYVLFLCIFCTNLYAKDYNVFSLGLYDVKFDGSSSNQATDFRYERRFGNAIIDIGPEQDNFFFLKPLVGIEYTSDKASYVLAGIYLEDNIGKLISGKENKFVFTPSFGFGYYDNGSGKNLGNSLQFRTTLEVGYILKDDKRVAIKIPIFIGMK